MPTPDVRVRLSAEGVAEVVSALKKIQAEGDKTSRTGGRSFLNLNSVLGSTTRLLAGLGVAIGVGSFVKFIRHSAQAADQVGKLGQKVGASVENLSALNLAASTASVSSEQLATGLIYMNRQITELARGSPQAQEMFREIGLSVRDFKGKDAVQSFELISKRMNELEDGSRKTAIAMDIFSRSGAQLIPLMNDLADEGLTNVIERARELGVLLDEEMVASIQQTNDDFELLNRQSQALGAQFATGIAPALSQSLQIITGDVSDMGEAWRKMGEGAGLVAKILVAVVATAIDTVADGILQTIGYIDALWRAGKRVLKGDFSGARDILRERTAIEEARAEAFTQRVKSRFKMAFTTPTPAEPRQRRPGSQEDPVELVRRQADATKSIRDAELAYLKAQLKARQDAEKRSYEEGASSLQDYFAERRRIVTEQTNAEIEALQKRLPLLELADDQVKAQAEAQRINLQIQTLRLEHEGEIAALHAEEAKALREMGAKNLETERQLLEARGQRHEAAMLAINEEIERADLLFRQQGMADERRLAVLEELRASMTAAADFDAAQTRAQAAMTDLGLERQRIDAQIRAGLVTQLDGEQRILALEQARLGNLEQLAQSLLAAAQATGDPEKIQQAREFALAVDELRMTAEGAADSMVRLRDAIQQSGIQALTDLFAEGIRAGQTFQHAMAETAMIVVQSLRRIVSEMLATMIVTRLFRLSLPGGGGGGGEPEPKQASGGLVRDVRFSSGGLLRGPGTGTSDSLVAFTESGRRVRLSNGEFVVRAAAVRQPGALEFLRDFNRWSMAALRPVRPAPPLARFAEGGMIGAAPAGGSLTVGLDEGLVLKALETPRGQRILVELVGRNRRTLQRVLER